MNAFLNRLEACWAPLSGGTQTKTLRFAAVVWALLAGFVLNVAAVDPPPSARTIESITIGGVTYTKVTVIDIAGTHVSFRSAQGFATVRIADLDPDIQARLAGRAPEIRTAGSSDERAVVPSSKKGKFRKAVKVQARAEKPAAAAAGQDVEEEEEDDDDDCAESIPIQWTPRNMIGVGVLGLGLLALCVGHIWFICAGFHTSVLWGIILLFGSVVADIMFCVGHWDAARRPTYVQLAGIGLLVGGWTLFTR